MGKNFYGVAVREITHPACEAQTQSVDAGEVAEEDALDTTVDEGVELRIPLMESHFCI